MKGVPPRPLTGPARSVPAGKGRGVAKRGTDDSSVSRVACRERVDARVADAAAVLVDADAVIVEGNFQELVQVSHGRGVCVR